MQKNHIIIITAPAKMKNLGSLQYKQFKVTQQENEIFCENTMMLNLCQNAWQRQPFILLTTLPHYVMAMIKIITI